MLLDKKGHSFRKFAKTAATVATSYNVFRKVCTLYDLNIYIFIANLHSLRRTKK